MKQTITYYVLISIFFLQPAMLFAQFNMDSVSLFIPSLHDKGPAANRLFNKRLIDLKTYPLSIALFHKLEEKNMEGDSYFQAKLNCTKAVLLYAARYPLAGDSITMFFKMAINEAYETGDDNLIYYISMHDAAIMEVYGNLELSAMYYLNAAELHDKVLTGDSDFNYWQVGSLLYHTRDYRQSIYYIKRSIANIKDTATNYWILTSCWNTIGLNWQKLEKYDSALLYYNRAMIYADKWPNALWKGFISGNKGQTYYQLKEYKLAKPLLLLDYKTSKEQGYFDNAANSLQWLAKISMIDGKKDSALIEVREAIGLLNKIPNIEYRHNLYATAADVYRANNKTDSFYYYSDQYNKLHDSIEARVANSRAAVARMKLENEQNIFRIRSLQKEKESEENNRNFIIIAVLLIAVIVLFYLNRLRLKNRLKEQEAIKEKEAAEANVIAAKSALEQFTQHVIEKNSLIETLQQQVQQKMQAKEQLELIDHLTGQSILTEPDWEKFKSLFEKIYPGFFSQLRNLSPDITSAEIRMAALIRLQLSNKQIASMLGISPDSVGKTRQRLRQRLALNTETNLDDFIVKFPG